MKYRTTNELVELLERAKGFARIAKKHRAPGLAEDIEASIREALPLARQLIEELEDCKRWHRVKR